MSRALFDEAVRLEGDISDLMARVGYSIYHQESGAGRNTKTSNRGAVGGMQVLPGTFKQVADKDWDINNPVHNIRAGLRYLKWLDKKAGGDPRLLAAGYYGGPGGLEKARQGIAVSDPVNPRAPNTLEYGEQVARRLGEFGKPRQVAQAPVVAPAPAPAANAPQTRQEVPASVPVATAAPGAPQPVPLPAQLVEYLASRSASLGGQTQSQANAWTAFLRNMEAKRQPEGRGVAPPQESQEERMPAPMGWASFGQVAGPSNTVNFNPFAGFGQLMGRTQVPR